MNSTVKCCDLETPDAFARLFNPTAGNSLEHVSNSEARDCMIVDILPPLQDFPTIVDKARGDQC